MARVTAGTAGVGRGPVRPALARALRACVALAPLAGGCVEQTLTVDSNPPGAVVYLNDQEVGRTPMKTDFKWHGWYDVVLRKEGYETLKTRSPVIAPAWNWMPFDLFAELLPVRLKDEQHLNYSLQPVSDHTVDPHRLVRQGERLRTELETGVNPARVAKPKAEIPATRPSSRPKPRPPATTEAGPAAEPAPTTAPAEPSAGPATAPGPLP